MKNCVEPKTWMELAEILRSSSCVVVGEELPFRYTPERVSYDVNGAIYEENWTIEVEGKLAAQSHDFVHVDLGKLPKKFELDEQNQTLVVSAGSSLPDIHRQLQDTDFALPHSYEDGGCARQALPLGWEVGCGPIGEAIVTNWPHLLQSQHGSWRDWITEATVMLADGTVVKSGSRVVKSVTGFDLHKLLIGSRFTLGLLLEVCVKVFPRGSVCYPEVAVNMINAPGSTIYPLFGKRLYWAAKPGISASMFESEFGIRPWIHDVRAGVLWFEHGPLSDLPAGLREDVRTTFWVDEPEIHSPQTQALMRRTKQLFDPTNKLNPGEFGFI